MTNDPTKTLWNNARQEDSDALAKLVPAEGRVEGKNNKALELYRQFANAYYDLHNNGGGNWQNHSLNFRRVCKAYGVEPISVRDMRWELFDSYSTNGVCARLEELGNKVIDAAIYEQIANVMPIQQAA